MRTDQIEMTPDGYVTLTNGLRIYLEEHGEGQPL
jgi:hypothetical protein